MKFQLTDGRKWYKQVISGIFKGGQIVIYLAAIISLAYLMTDVYQNTDISSVRWEKVFKELGMILIWLLMVVAGLFITGLVIELYYWSIRKN